MISLRIFWFQFQWMFLRLLAKIINHWHMRVLDPERATSLFFIGYKKNAFANFVCNMVAMLLRSQYIKIHYLLSASSILMTTSAFTCFLWKQNEKYFNAPFRIQLSGSYFYPRGYGSLFSSWSRFYYKALLKLTLGLCLAKSAVNLGHSLTKVT